MSDFVAVYKDFFWFVRHVHSSLRDDRDFILQDVIALYGQSKLNMGGLYMREIFIGFIL